MNPALIFLLNLAATWYLVGLIWMVQIVHYPLFDRVGEQQFQRYETDHNRLITPIVGLPMLIEIATACMLLLATPAGFPRWAAWVGLALVAAIWLSTAFIQVPSHQQLINGFQQQAYDRLVGTNWIRTVCWSARGILMGYFALQLLRGPSH